MAAVKHGLCIDTNSSQISVSMVTYVNSKHLACLKHEGKILFQRKDMPVYLSGNWGCFPSLKDIFTSTEHQITPQGDYILADIGVNTKVLFMLIQPLINSMTLWQGLSKEAGPHLNIKTVFPRYGDSHVKDKTVGETVLSLTWESLYW